MVSKSFQFATTRSSHTRLIGCMNSVFTSLDTGVFPAWYMYIVCLTLFLALLFRLAFILVFLECFVMHLLTRLRRLMFLIYHMMTHMAECMKKVQA